jgi:predicted O-methyltransferase YrrM
MRGNAPHNQLTGVPSWETVDEMTYLAQVASEVPAGGVILEIGGEFGGSASVFSKFAPECRIYSIDIRFDTEIGEIHKANLAEAGVGSNVTRITANSQIRTTLVQFKKANNVKAVDLLFIDGDHSYEGALNDLNVWSPLVKVGGLIVLHDTASATNKLPHPLHFEVSRALEDWYRGNDGAWEFSKNVDTIASFVRIK